MLSIIALKGQFLCQYGSIKAMAYSNDFNKKFSPNTKENRIFCCRKSLFISENIIEKITFSDSKR